MCGSTPCGCHMQQGEYNGGGVKGAGHPLVNWPGWRNNDARASIQTDIMPLPISPVHHQSWPGMQVQLSNGWELTNYGKIASYNSYLRMAGGTSGTYNKSKAPLPGNGLQPTAYAPPSQIQLSNVILAGNNQDGVGATGALAPGVQAQLAGRRYYG